MRTSQLEYFASVARHLNFTEAARECHVAQPAISQQIQALEKELGYALFERSSKGVALTEAGRQYQLDIERILESLNRANRKASAISQGEAGVLTFGVSGSNQLSYMRVLESFHSHCPEIELDLRRVNAKNQYEQLKTGSFDVLHSGTGNYIGKSDVVVSGVQRSMLKFVMSKTHPLAERENLTLDDLRPYPHIMAESENPDAAKEVYPYLDPRNDKILYTEDQDISWLMIGLGLGVAAVPDGVIPGSSAEVVVREVPQYLEYLEMGWVSLASNENPALQKFINYLER
ncbi:MAG: LysR family transcriptional regulator [Raoultibacter sp.]|jgi:DNA-binding transcriptional LysR family regulator